jgi:hypothetical protein
MKNGMILVAVTILLAFTSNANAQGYGHRGGGHYDRGYDRGCENREYNRGYENRGYNRGYDRGYGYGRGYYRPNCNQGYYAPNVAVYQPVAPVYAYQRPRYCAPPRPYFRGPRVRVNIGF